MQPYIAGMMRTLLRRTAVDLYVRGSKDLAREVLAEASGYPESDKLPDGPAPEHEEVLKTSDWGEELGVPPYTTRRPKVKDADVQT